MGERELNNESSVENQISAAAQDQALIEDCRRLAKKLAEKINKKISAMNAYSPSDNEHDIEYLMGELISEYFWETENRIGDVLGDLSSERPYTKPGVL